MKLSISKICLLIAIGLASVVCTACKKDEPAIEVASISMESTLSLVVGEDENLAATITPDNATDKTITWTSSNTTIATVDVDGKVSAIAEGVATIIAQAGNKIAICELTVTLDQKIIDAGVVINGVTWATRNVDAFGTFAEKPESPGMFYQWNRPQAWNTSDETVTGWDATVPEGSLWEKANDPSPKGWRIPTYSELWSLLDEQYVTKQRTTQNGVQGYKFTDKANGNSIFFPTPSSSSRNSNDGTLVFWEAGYYWSNTAVGNSKTYAYFMFLLEGIAAVSYDPNYYRNDAFFVRSVLIE